MPSPPHDYRAVPEAMAGPDLAWRRTPPILRTPHAHLREVATRDASDLATSLGVPEVMQYLPPGPTSPEQFARFIAWARAERGAARFLCFAVFPESRPTAAGIFQMWPIEPKFSVIELGFALTPALWGTGIFHECATRVIDYAFTTLGARRIECRTVVSNGRGIGGLRKIGAVYEGTLRRCAVDAQGTVDHTLWSILDAEWHRQRVSSHVRVA